MEQNKEPELPKWWDIKQLAAALSCSVSTARRRARQADFPPAYRLSARIIRWRADQVRAWCDSQAVEPALATAREWKPRQAPAPHGPHKRSRAA